MDRRIREGDQYFLCLQLTLFLIQDLRSALSLSNGKKMLEVGCGTGGNVFQVAQVAAQQTLKKLLIIPHMHSFCYQKYGVDVTGIDLSENMISIANKRLEGVQDCNVNHDDAYF